MPSTHPLLQTRQCVKSLNPGPGRVPGQRDPGSPRHRIARPSPRAPVCDPLRVGRPRPARCPPPAAPAPPAPAPAGPPPAPAPPTPLAGSSRAPPHRAWTAPPANGERRCERAKTDPANGSALSHPRLPSAPHSPKPHVRRPPPSEVPLVARPQVARAAAAVRRGAAQLAPCGPAPLPTLTRRKRCFRGKRRQAWRGCFSQGARAEAPASAGSSERHAGRKGQASRSPATNDT